MSDDAISQPQTFGLIRDHDVTGISGTGRVADGTLWPDGTVSVRWRSDRPSIVHWGSLADVEHVHGHGGHTRIVWDGEQQRPTPWSYEQACAALERHRQRADEAEATIARVHAEADHWRRNSQAWGPYAAARIRAILDGPSLASDEERIRRNAILDVAQARGDRDAVARVRDRCQEVRDRVGPSGMINASQILGLLSPTWPDGNYAAADGPSAPGDRAQGD